VGDERVGVRAAARPERARDGRGDAATHAPGGHRLHEHDQREGDGDAGEGVGAEPADEVGLEDADRHLRREHDDVGRREREERRGDRTLEEPPGRRVHVTC